MQVNPCRSRFTSPIPGRESGYSTRLPAAAPVTMPFQETFCAQRFAMVTDRFATPRMVDCPPAS